MFEEFDKDISSYKNAKVTSMPAIGDIYVSPIMSDGEENWYRVKILEIIDANVSMTITISRVDQDLSSLSGVILFIDC